MKYIFYFLCSIVLLIAFLITIVGGLWLLNTEIKEFAGIDVIELIRGKYAKDSKKP